jgi:hypothetical protein
MYRPSQEPSHEAQSRNSATCGSPLAIAGCGGSSATPRTSAGVESDYVQFAKLVSSGKGAAACSRYVAPPLVAELAALGGCAKLLDYEVAKQGGLNPSTVANGWAATVTSTRATYRTTKASGTAVYVDGHWMFGQDSSSTTSRSTSGGTSADAAAKELAHSAQVAIETYATDNGGSYAAATAATLNTYESTIQVGAGNANAYIAANGVTATASSYTLTATASNDADKFSITRSTNGSITRTCVPVGQGGCLSNGIW